MAAKPGFFYRYSFLMTWSLLMLTSKILTLFYDNIITQAWHLIIIFWCCWISKYCWGFLFLPPLLPSDLQQLSARHHGITNNHLLLTDVQPINVTSLSGSITFLLTTHDVLMYFFRCVILKAVSTIHGSIESCSCRKSCLIIVL